MFACAEVERLLATDGTDPRLDPRYVRCGPESADQGAILLVGVVHDHPASLGRVATLLEALSPDVLALELPPLAVPLFDCYADDVFEPPRLGGEMSLALQILDETPVVGIDGPNADYLRAIGERLVAGEIPRDLLRRVGTDLANSSLHAIACGLGAWVGRLTGLRLRVYDHLRYDVSLLDPPRDQGEHESKFLAKQQSFLRAIEVPRGRHLIDEIREESMAARLQRLRRRGDVVAIVGMEHLDGVCDRLNAHRALGPGVG